MLIIVEGVDGSGKTTLIQQIREGVPRSFWMMKSSNRPRLKSEILNLELWVQTGLRLKLNLLFDRFPLISERIYGQVIRGRSLVSLDYDQISKSLWSLCPDQSSLLIIHCRPPDEKIKQRVRNCPQMEGVHDHIGQLIVEYDYAMSVLGKSCPIITYNSEIDDFRELLTRITVW
jgi:hypothetical protein